MSRAGLLSPEANVPQVPRRSPASTVRITTSIRAASSDFEARRLLRQSARHQRQRAPGTGPMLFLSLLAYQAGRLSKPGIFLCTPDFLSRSVRYQSISHRRDRTVFSGPKRYRHQKTSQTGWRIREIGMQNPIEFQERLFVERHVIELIDVEAAFTKAISHRVLRKTRVVLFACESFFLGRCNDFSFAHQACRAVVIKSGQTEDIRERILFTRETAAIWVARRSH